MGLWVDAKEPDGTPGPGAGAAAAGEKEGTSDGTGGCPERAEAADGAAGAAGRADKNSLASRAITAASGTKSLVVESP